MHWGGGTPNFLEDGQLVALTDMLRHTFEIDARTECSVEADPRLVNRHQLRTLRSLGFSRISYGVQDLDPVVQEAIGRVQPETLVREAATSMPSSTSTNSLPTTDSSNSGPTGCA